MSRVTRTNDSSDDMALGLPGSRLDPPEGGTEANVPMSATLMKSGVFPIYHNSEQREKSDRIWGWCLDDTDAWITLELAGVGLSVTGLTDQLVRPFYLFGPPVRRASIVRF